MSCGSAVSGMATRRPEGRVGSSTVNTSDGNGSKQSHSAATGLHAGGGPGITTAPLLLGGSPSEPQPPPTHNTASNAAATPHLDNETHRHQTLRCMRAPCTRTSGALPEVRSPTPVWQSRSSLPVRGFVTLTYDNVPHVTQTSAPWGAEQPAVGSGSTSYPNKQNL